jgi:hypothetical protein
MASAAAFQSSLAPYFAHVASTLNEITFINGVED